MTQQQPEWYTYVPLKWVARPETVLTSTLSPVDRATLWRGIQRQNPALAKMLKTDPAIEELKRVFNATVALEKPDFDRYMQAGQQEQ